MLQGKQRVSIPPSSPFLQYLFDHHPLIHSPMDFHGQVGEVISLGIPNYWKKLYILLESPEEFLCRDSSDNYISQMRIWDKKQEKLTFWDKSRKLTLTTWWTIPPASYFGSPLLSPRTSMGICCFRDIVMRETASNFLVTIKSWINML